MHLQCIFPTNSKQCKLHLFEPNGSEWNCLAVIQCKAIQKPKGIKMRNNYKVSHKSQLMSLTLNPEPINLSQHMLTVFQLTYKHIIVKLLKVTMYTNMYVCFLYYFYYQTKTIVIIYFYNTWDFW